ncbi:septum site-determining protein MinC [Helicobacter japonicus]|uniref:Septum site-determining protein MinC n=1 Tax=Helicobacter japonicus TaxID=425400 RepID=A0A099BB25_9HELI|nr:septum site-determining protein MinC [Helicobacter japonicus]MDE7235933.1 septum site-determining protein MinC [Helicobacter japonicus]TLE02884.1 septum site-determining protein MinC [Helicobacter japonicus]
MIKTRQRKIVLFEFEENRDTQECIAFITKHLPLLKYHTLGFRGQIAQELESFLHSHHLSFALLSGELPTRDMKSYLQKESVALVKDSKKDNDTPRDEAKYEQNAFERTLWIHRIVRSGEEIHHNGDIVIESRVNSGARIVAEGNLYLFGECSGSIEAQGDFIICHKIFTPAILLQDTIISQDILHTINQSNALFKMIFKNGDNIETKDLA